MDKNERAYILGIETSCDETAAAVVDVEGKILSNIVHSQLEDHAPFGGVVPEVAARAHIHHIGSIVTRAMDEAKLNYEDLTGVAATCGPGLIGGVMIGMMTGKAIAAAHNKPFYAINHLEGHALTPRLTDDAPFPYLLLLVSGGHTQLLVVEGVGKYARLGTTIDDAIGEAFDKTAKLLGLPHPGGPHLEKLAASASGTIDVTLPRPMVGREGCDFSLSGLKTAVRNAREKVGEAAYPALAREFQTAICEIITDRVQNALHTYIRDFKPERPTLVVAGGVAANQAIRSALQDLADKNTVTLACPPPALCTDNGAMIAWAGMERYKAGIDANSLDVKARPRWPLDPEAAPKPGAGIKA